MSKTSDPKTTDRDTIAFVGLGAMGLGMAQTCLRAGHRVLGLDLNEGAVARLIEAGGEKLTQDTAHDAAIFVSVVLNAAQTRAILYDDPGFARHLPGGAVIVSCATISPEDARDNAAQAEGLGLLYLDAPISGGAARAAQGELSIMASGSREAFQAATPALSAMAHSVHDLGPEAGAGSAMKAVNQLLAGVHIAAMGEALALGISQGLTPERILQVISVSAGTSWMFENRAPRVVEGDYEARSAVDIWPKDLGIVTEIAESAALSTPVAGAALARFREASSKGLGALDDSAITQLYASEAGLSLPGRA